MKKVVYGSLFALVATFGIVSCDKEEINPVSSKISSLESDELNEQKAEELRLQFASNMVTFVNDTKETFQNVEYVHSLEKSGDNTAPTFEEFLAEVPGGEGLTDIGLQLIKEAYELHIANTSNDNILNNYQAEGFFLMANEIANNGKTFEEVVFTSEVNNQKICIPCIRVWNGIKNGANWVYDNREEIGKTITYIITTILSIKEIIG